MIDFSNEIIFQTTRSGGKGGQNVNKVETAVIGYLNIDTSSLLSDEQKTVVKEKLFNRINADGLLFVKSQVHRTQYSNKLEAAEKINELIYKAVQKKKKRLATKLPKAVKEKRLEGKKKKSEVKEGRKKFRPDNF